MTLTVVHLVRHGEVHNPDGMLYGRLPGYRLSDRGERQAAQVAEALADRDITAVLASPLERAQQTAAPIAAAHGLEVITEPGLIEAGNLFEGTAVGLGDGVLRNPRNWWKLRNPFRPSWGEPYSEIVTRMLAAAQHAAVLADGHEAVCVSHQLPIWTLRQHLLGKRLWHDPRRRECALGSLTSLDFVDGQFAGLHYSEPAGSSDPTVTGA
jgi:broad specificity phosphatase PhoE